MRINKIHIKHFGGLSDFTLLPNDGFSVVFGENEQGKTTVMSFLRLMFYGEGVKKNDIKMNLRRRFTPFSGEKAGGEVEFTHDGKSYRLSKQFGKTPRSDRVSLLDTIKGEEISLPAGLEIGEMFFSLSAEAFERSIFIGSLPTDGDGSAELSRRLSQVALSGEDGYSYGEVDARLEAAQTALRTPRRVGALDRVEEKIQGLLREKSAAEENATAHAERVAEVERLESALLESKAEKEELTRLERLSRSREAAAAYKAESDNRKRYKMLCVGTKFDEAAIMECENLIAERDRLLSRLEALREQTGAAPQVKGGDELSAAVSMLSETEEKISAKKAEKTSLLLPLVTGSIFFISGVLMLCMKLHLWISMLGFMCFSLIWLIIKKNRGEKSKTRELSLLEAERRERNDRVIILTERKKQSEEELREWQDESLRKENREKEITGEIARLSAELKGRLGEGDERALLKQNRERLAMLREAERQLMCSPYHDMTDEDLAERAGSKEAVEVPYSAEELSRKIAALDAEIGDEIARSQRLRSDAEMLLKSGRTVAVIENEISETEAKRERMQKTYDAILLARRALAEANDDMRQNFAPELNRLTGELFCRLTGGRHTRVNASGELSLTVSSEGELPFSAEQLSAGSFDQAELCLRLSLARLTGGENALPLMLDDVLMQYDDRRAALAIDFLRDYARDNQVMLFTCHGFIKGLAKKEEIIPLKRG